MLAKKRFSGLKSFYIVETVKLINLPTWGLKTNETLVTLFLSGPKVEEVKQFTKVGEGIFEHDFVKSR